ncbi:MAG: cobyrinate a,c-diamide synthase [Nitrospinales bacterium]
MIEHIEECSGTSFKGLMIAGTHSSVGKTSITLGLMKSIQQKGYKVQPFKVGPDYIDTGHHTLACGRPSYNLDSSMCNQEYVRNLYKEVSLKGDISIAEGVMGLFDGAFPKNEEGSSAQIAKILGLKIILIIDGSAMARSAAALVQGFINFDPSLQFLGVIANRVNSTGHANILKEAIEHHTSCKFLGNIPTSPSLTIKERHLGLHMDIEQTEELYDQWADHINQNLDVQNIIDKLKRKEDSPKKINVINRWKSNPGNKEFTVAIAKDEAFPFLYQDTLDLIKHYGGSIKYFSPLTDSELPENIDWVYIPGGYPELHADKLSKNFDLLRGIKSLADEGKPVVGECGGLMYLGQDLIDKQGASFTMAGVFNFSTTMKDQGLKIGYRKLSYQPTMDDKQQLLLRGHDFHVSSFRTNGETPLMNHRIHGKDFGHHDGYRNNNSFAFYSHIYWASSIGWWEYLLNNFILKSHDD